MNFFSSKLTLIMALAGSLLIGCSKKPLELPQRPDQPVETPKPVGINLAFQLPQGSAVEADSATLTLLRNGQSQQARVKIQTTNNTAGSGLIELPAGEYQLTHLILTNAQGKVVYASPRTHSAKAAQVSRPLPASLTAAPQPAAVAMEVLAVVATDQPLSFGYPQEAFQQQMMTRVNIEVGIKVGNTVYKNFEAPLELTWFDAQGQSHVQLLQLPANASGTTAIGLPAEGTRFELRLSKWDLTLERKLTAAEVQKDMVIELNGNTMARQLKEEYTWHEIEGEYRPYSRKTYEYDAAGRLIKTMYYQKKPQSMELQLQMIDEMVYQGNTLTSILFADGNNVRTGFIHFVYDANNRVSHMEQRTQAGTTYASVAYGLADNRREEVTIDYLFDNGHAMEYKMVFDGGNKVEESAASSTGSREGGTFTYDNNINPFFHLGIQDIYLRYLSRNNKISDNKGYGGNIPSNVPYKQDYSYDSKGYPTQLITSFKTYTTGTHLFRAKTQYTYNN